MNGLEVSRVGNLFCTDDVCQRDALWAAKVAADLGLSSCPIILTRNPSFLGRAPVWRMSDSNPPIPVLGGELGRCYPRDSGAARWLIAYHPVVTWDVCYLIEVGKDLAFYPGVAGVLAHELLHVVLRTKDEAAIDTAAHTLLQRYTADFPHRTWGTIKRS